MVGRTCANGLLLPRSRFLWRGLREVIMRLRVGLPQTLRVLMLLLLAACTGRAAPAQAPPPAGPSPASAGAAAATSSPPTVTVKVGTVPGAISNAGRFVAIERGYFLEEGIDFEEVAFDTSAKMLPALAAGQIDVGIGGSSAGLFNAIAQGIPLKIVLDSTSAYPGDSAGGLLVRK